MTTAPATPARHAAPRLLDDDALAMYMDCSIHELGRRAHAVTMRLHPETYRTYVVDRNINYSNYCTAKCIFCNFKADPPGMDTGRKDLPPGYVLSYAQIGAKIEGLLEIGGTQVLMQGGLVPAEMLPFEWYLDLFRFIKREYPQIHIHALSPPEIFALHQVFNMSVRDVLLRLRDAGLDSIPGGGAEILADRVRNRIAQGKTNTEEYLHVMREAHGIGMRTSITMMFGHIETIEERIVHLRRIRDLQDETGGFTAFICWTFQPGDTPLGRVQPWEPAGGDHHGGEPGAVRAGVDLPDGGLAGGNAPSGTPAGGERPGAGKASGGNARGRDNLPDGRRLKLADAHEYLKMTALARVYLDNIPNVQSSWVTQGVKIGQLALFYGANDMGSVMMEENVVSAAGTTYRLTEEEIRAAIRDAGFQPRKRNFYYELLEV